MDHIDTGFTIFRSLLLIGALFLTIKKYRKTRINTLVYLIVATLSYLVSELLDLFFIEPSQRESTSLAYDFIRNLSILVVLLFATLITFYMLRLFIESFDVEKITTKWLLFLGGVVVFNITGLIVTSIIGSGSVLDGLAERFNEDVFYISIFFTWVMWFIFFILAFVVVIVLLIDILRKITIKIRNFEDEQTIKIIRYMRYAIFAILLGTILPFLLFIPSVPFIPYLSSTISVLGLVTFVVIYLRSGVYTLADESLKRLLIVNSKGLPIYGYVFRTFSQSKMSTSEPMEQEMLFSGALKAINSLIEEFTGHDDDIEELKMKETTIMFDRISNDVRVLLMAGNSTVSYWDTLNAFVSKVNTVFDNNFPSDNISTEQIKLLNSITEELFGPGVGTS